MSDFEECVRYMYMYEYYCTVQCTVLVLVLVRYMYRYLYLYGQYLYSYGTCARISSHPWGSITGLTAHQQLDSRPALGNEMTHSENDLRPKIRDFWFLIPQEGVNFALRNAAKCQRIGAKMPKMPRGVQNAEKCREGSRMPKALPAPNRRPNTRGFQHQSTRAVGTMRVRRKVMCNNERRERHNTQHSRSL